jgi:hypothetical protein
VMRKTGVRRVDSGRASYPKASASRPRRSSFTSDLQLA